MKRLYSKLKLKYREWQTKRFYKKMLNIMPVHDSCFVLPDGSLCLITKEAEFMMIVGSGIDSLSWPNFIGVKMDVEYEEE